MSVGRGRTRPPSLAGRAARWALVMLAIVASAPAAVAGAADEYAVKAAFLFNFTRFVEWPAAAFDGPDAPFRICVFGEDPFGPRLEALSRRQVGERPIAVVRDPPADALAGCQIAYLGTGTPVAVQADAAAGGAPMTLAVASGRGFAASGGMFGLVTEGGRVRLQVNLQQVRRSPLRVSAKLLEVAEARGVR